MTSAGKVFQGPVRAAVLGVALVVLLAGCREECKLDGDCKGQSLVCEASQCVRLEVYGVHGGKVERLGNWPALESAGTPVFDVVAPEDREAPADCMGPGHLCLGGYLASNGTHLLSGYTVLTNDFDNTLGKVAVYPLDASTPTYVEARGNLSAAAMEGGFLINGQSLDTQAQGTGVYGLKTGGTAPTASVVAVPGASVGKAYASSTVMTTQGVGVLGYYASATNVLRAVAPARLQEALSSGTPVDLSTMPQVYAQGDLQGVARFGAGVALLRGSYQPDWSVAYTDVAYVPVTLKQDGTAEVGALATALRFRDGCTQVVLMSHLGEDLLVGLKDKNGRRLVRVRAGEGVGGEDKGNSQAEAIDCAAVAHDAQLGTLQLKPGFTVLGSAPLPEGVGDVAIVTRKP